MSWVCWSHDGGADLQRATGGDGMKRPLLQELAEYAVSIRWSALPQVVQDEARLNVLDTIGCMASGARLDETRRLLAAERVLGEQGRSSVLGARGGFSAQSAARINAYMGDVFELNDLIGGHASIGTVTPALALAEANNR